MNKICYLLMVTSLLYSGLVFGKEVACIPRAEMGETTTGQHLYERDAELKIRNLSRIDFDELTITSAEGNRSRIVRVEENLYKTAGTGAPYYFVTNDKKSIVTELSVRSNATYIKVLLCK
jgi:hypothetical protein